MDQYEEFLVSRLPRFARSCERAARKVGGRCTAEDLLQASIEEFLSTADRWFEHGETRDYGARATTHLYYCLKHQVTKAQRNKEPAPHPEGEEEAPEPVSTEPDPDSRLAAKVVLENIEQIGSPARRLVLLTLYLPHLVTLDHFSSAASSRATLLTHRSPTEAWTAYRRLLGRPGTTSPEAAWRRRMAWLLYLPGPWEDASEAAVDDATRAYSRLARYARAELAERLEGHLEEMD